MSDLENIVVSLVAELGTGTDEDAFHNLIELGPEILSILMSSFRHERRPAIRVRLIEVISHFQDSGTIECLERALDDPDTSVWKACLDGLVAVGGLAVFAALQRTKGRELASNRKDRTRVEWINEALVQTRKGLG